MLPLYVVPAVLVVLGIGFGLRIISREKPRLRIVALLALSLLLMALFVVSVINFNIRADETATTGGFGTREVVLGISSLTLFLTSLLLHRRDRRAN